VSFQRKKRKVHKRNQKESKFSDWRSVEWGDGKSVKFG